MERSKDWIKQAERDLQSAQDIRYPNGWPAGAPFEYITEEDAKSALIHSEKIIRFCKDILSG